MIFILVGIINGLFSSGAGQLLIFYWVYILKRDTKKSRQLSLMIMPIISIPTFIYYLLKIQINITQFLVLVIISLLGGYIGNKLMRKMNGNKLNLISGVFLVVLTLYSLWRMK
ncbi:MAG: sulfite exporter TauE/SafE family protein [Clostridia bacterium]|nr:sulfite exporter TauE/SafE family protein [Clostridia bacterium]